MPQETTKCACGAAIPRGAATPRHTPNLAVEVAGWKGQVVICTGIHRTAIGEPPFPYLAEALREAGAEFGTASGVFPATAKLYEWARGRMQSTTTQRLMEARQQKP